MSKEDPTKRKEGRLELQRIEDLLERTGFVIESEPIGITQDMINRFADLTGDLNEAHQIPETADRSIFGGVVVHGFLVMSLSAHRTGLKNNLIIAEPNEVVSLGIEDAKFHAPVMVGTELIYQYVLDSAKKIKIKNNPAVSVKWKVKATDRSGKEFFTGNWKLMYVSNENLKHE